MEYIARPKDRLPWASTYAIKADICACHNTTIFLRSLYFQLALTENPPRIAADLAGKIVDALKVIDRGFYKLP